MKATIIRLVRRLGSREIQERRVAIAYASRLRRTGTADSAALPYYGAGVRAFRSANSSGPRQAVVPCTPGAYHVRATIKRFPAFLLAVSLVGCASGGAKSAASGTSATAAMTAAAAPRGSTNVIVESEIPASGAQNALEVIQRVRPSMLRARNGTTEETGVMDIVFYIDGTRAGERQALTAIPASNVREIRYLNATDATTRFGTGHALGAIIVSTKR